MFRTDYIARVESRRPAKTLLLMFRQEMMVQGGPQMEAGREKRGGILEILEADRNAKRRYHLAKGIPTTSPSSLSYKVSKACFLHCIRPGW